MRRSHHEMFDDGRIPTAATATSISGQAVPVKGGYTLTGRWPFASGVRHAEWMVAGAKVPARENTEETSLTLVYPVANGKIHDNWHVMGLEGSGSNDISASELFVPCPNSPGRPRYGNLCAATQSTAWAGPASSPTSIPPSPWASPTAPSTRLLTARQEEARQSTHVIPRGQGSIPPRHRNLRLPPSRRQSAFPRGFRARLRNNLLRAGSRRRRSGRNAGRSRPRNLRGNRCRHHRLPLRRRLRHTSRQHPPALSAQRKRSRPALHGQRQRPRKLRRNSPRHPRNQAHGIACKIPSPLRGERLGWE